MTTRASLGNDTETFLRLWTRAPRTWISSSAVSLNPETAIAELLGRVLERGLHDEPDLREPPLGRGLEPENERRLRIGGAHQPPGVPEVHANAVDVVDPLAGGAQDRLGLVDQGKLEI